MCSLDANKKARLERGWKDEEWVSNEAGKRTGKDTREHFLFCPSLMMTGAPLFTLVELKPFESGTIAQSSYIPHSFDSTVLLSFELNKCVVKRRMNV